MPTYILLANYTEKGLHEIEESPNRLDKFKELCKQDGGRIVATYMTMGPYDLVIIVELPDDATLARLALMGGKAGDTRTVTLKAFPESEFRDIIGLLGSSP